MFSFNKPASAGAATATGTQSGGLFGQQNNANNMGTTPGTGFLAGQNSTGNNGNTGTGFSFGGQTQSQPQGAAAGAGGSGLFGNTSGTNNGGSGSGFSFGQQANKPIAGASFGGSNSNTSNGGSSLFRSGTSNTGTGGGLFGSNNAASNTNNSGGLFGSKPQGSSLFGQGSTTNSGTSGGLFGSNNSNTGNSGGGLFGNNSGTMNQGSFGANPSGGTSLFGNPTSAKSGLFGSQQGLFQPQQQQQQQQQTSLLAISQIPITPMTKISDLPPQLRQEIEQLDQYIQRQVQISQHLKADTSEHKELIDSIPNDIAYLFKTESLGNQSLTQDLKKIYSIKDITDQSIADSQTFSMILQQLLTPGSKISSMELDKFFHNRILVYQNKLDDYFNVLSDIESAVNGIDTDVVGGYPESHDVSNLSFPRSESLDPFTVKTGLNALVATVIEEFKLFMDTAERIAELHQKVKEVTIDRQS